MVGSSPAGGLGLKLALPPEGATLEEPEEAADRPGPLSAPPCCCCLHLGPGKRSLVHKQPGERTPPAEGQLPNATAEEEKIRRVHHNSTRCVSEILRTFLRFNTLDCPKLYCTMPVIPFLNLSQIRDILISFLMFPETTNCEKLTWITPDTDTANSRVSHGIPYSIDQKGN